MNKSAHWIKTGQSIGTVSPDFRKEIHCPKKIKKATAKVSAYGVYALTVNGERIGNALLSPGFTSYKTRIQYQTYDITEYMKEHNTVSIKCGKGWAVGRIGWIKKENNPTDGVLAIADIRIEYTDGTCDNTVTDGSWDVYTSEILDSEIYDGETVDMTEAPHRVCAAVIEKRKMPRLVKQINEPVTEKRRVAAVKLITTPKGERVIDFGQNLAGYAEYKSRVRFRLIPFIF